MKTLAASSLLNRHIGQSHGVIYGLAIIGGNDDQGFHVGLLPI
jgi:hypothetical protein